MSNQFLPALLHHNSLELSNGADNDRVCENSDQGEHQPKTPIHPSLYAHLIVTQIPG